MKITNRTRVLAFAAVTAAAALLHAGTAAADMAAEGEKLFKRCSSCHSLEAGKKKVGPSLAGIIGRAAGAEAYKYSKLNAAAAEAGLVWNEDNIVAYLADPTKFLTAYLTEQGMADKAKGRTRMSFKMPKEDQRKAIAAYIASLGK